MRKKWENASQTPHGAPFAKQSNDATQQIVFNWYEIVCVSFVSNAHSVYRPISTQLSRFFVNVRTQTHYAKVDSAVFVIQKISSGTMTKDKRRNGETYTSHVCAMRACVCGFMATCFLRFALGMFALDLRNHSTLTLLFYTLFKHRNMLPFVFFEKKRNKFSDFVFVLVSIS